MSELSNSAAQAGGMSREDELAALFGNLVVQQAQMALMLMGKVANPETGKPTEGFVSQLGEPALRSRNPGWIPASLHGKR